METARDTVLFPSGMMARRAGAVRPSCEIVTQADRMPERLAGSVLLLGNFDGFHCGHATLLDAARQVAGGTAIGIMSVEPHPRQLFAPGSEPFRITTARTKHDAFAGLGFSFAFMPCFTHAFAGQSAVDFVEQTLVRDLRVAHVVIGQDFRFGHRRAGDVALLRQIGMKRGFAVTEVAMLHRQDVICSSSLIRDMLRVGDMSAANAILGSPWSVEAGVLGRDAAGLSLAWPDDVILPPPGDYAVRVRGMGAPHDMATLRIDTDGIHLRGTGALPCLETLLIDFIGS